MFIAELETSSERRVLGDGRFQRLCFLSAKLTFVASLTSQAAGAAKAESSKPSCQSAIATPGASVDRGLIAAGSTCPVMPHRETCGLVAWVEGALCPEQLLPV